MAQNNRTHTVYDQHGNPIEVDAHHFEQSVKAAKQPSPQNPDAHHTGPQVVFMTRPHEPVAPKLSQETRRKHEDSKKKYPHLNLSEGEFVISAIKRHPIGLLGIWVVVMLAIIPLMAGLFATMAPGAGFDFLDESALPSLVLVFIGLILLLFMGGVIASVVYEANRFFLTNESVTQHIQTSLFAKKEQTISLGNIEDASFTQKGILQHMLNYGSLRLSTEGDETTYRFSFVENPANQVALLNNAVEAFKLGRPVDTDEN